MTATEATESKCPVDHSKMDKSQLPFGHPKIPISQRNESAAAGGGCPVDHSSASDKTHSLFGMTKQKQAPQSECSSNSTVINPANMMPNLSQTQAPGQKEPLPVERTLSSIPKGEASTSTKEVWEYPSPQQFYNALQRKGWETEEKEVPVMVEIHNFLNEACWQEILKWEEKYKCACPNPSLLRFKGRPSELTPKARLFTLFGGERPFDRHDWTVDRCGKEVRYVIDYYGGYDEVVDGRPMPVFHVDVRPAIDSPGALFDRTRMMFRNVWERCFGNNESATSSTTSR